MPAVDKLVTKLGFTADGPGVAIWVDQPGRLHFEKGYGLANLRSHDPITSKTLFELASVSKTFTSTAVLLLQDCGKLSIEDDVRKYLPELPEYDATRPIRIRDLLQHTSGLPEYLRWDNVPIGPKGYWVNEDFVSVFGKRRVDFPLDFPAGQKFEYCNSNFMLLALIVQRISKKSYGEFMHDEIFAPAGMSSTFVYENPGVVPKEHLPGAIPALGYEWDIFKRKWTETWGTPPARHETNLVVGDGGIWTNLEDMGRWDQALREEKILTPATWKFSRERSKTRDGKTNDYALGWIIYGDANSMYGYGHDGVWGGFRTSYYRYTARDRTTVILSNRGNFDPDTLWYPLDAPIEKQMGHD